MSKNWVLLAVSLPAWRNNGYSFLILETAVILKVPTGSNWLKMSCDLPQGTLTSLFPKTLIGIVLNWVPFNPSPQGTIGNVWRHFLLPWLGRCCWLSSKQRPGMLPNILQGTRQQRHHPWRQGIIRCKMSTVPRLGKPCLWGEGFRDSWQCRENELQTLVKSPPHGVF